MGFGCAFLKEILNLFGNVKSGTLCEQWNFHFLDLGCFSCDFIAAVLYQWEHKVCLTVIYFATTTDFHGSLNSIKTAHWFDLILHFWLAFLSN